MDLTWHSPSDPEQHPTLELRRDWDTSWGAARLSGRVPYLPHGALLDRNQQRRVADIPQAFSGVISEQRVDARRRDFLRRMPGRAAPIKTHMLVHRLLAENE